MSTSTLSHDSLWGDFLKLFLAVVAPPVSVFIESGISKDLFLNVVLTLLGFFPGIIHAVYVSARK
ncbi:YqaE/Pmp3 family membrane protein [Rubinisphaera margarita]|uniref:YqaE/Pmp3 family membrane protein n=1 Tax=Rubinisphaera margarita TaxID=2909586 RepID=UPI001EE900F8|nr:YqaE/Pmp3 family membrane protein [Rubinisphaera margarita]MCG6155099.1 YqaE/Pmp3 family membrane protein [Rubinisphaera margarita]